MSHTWKSTDKFNLNCIFFIDKISNGGGVKLYIYFFLSKRNLRAFNK